MNNFNWDSGFSIDFNLISGISQSATPTRRYLSDMRNMFFDTDAADQLIKDGNPLVYEFHELGCPERPGDLAFGTTILHPGTVGDEYFMTKGHFHTILDTAEIYYTLSGEGYMILENPEGDCQELVLEQNKAIYVPRRYAHRTVNTGTEPLILFYAFPADAGHDYGSIEEKGYRKLIMQLNGTPTIIDNPKWK